MFNYNNHYLVELPLLYECLEQFIGGTPIHNFFFGRFRPLTTNVGWLSENPEFGARYVALWHFKVPWTWYTSIAICCLSLWGCFKLRLGIQLVVVVGFQHVMA